MDATTLRTDDVMLWGSTLVRTDGHGTEVQLRIGDVVFGPVFQVQALALDVADDADNLTRLCCAVVAGNPASYACRQGSHWESSAAQKLHSQ